MNLYLDCVGGVAGDMLAAALIDVGAPVESINRELDKLGVPGLQMTVTRTERHSIGAALVDVAFSEDHSHSHGDHSTSAGSDHAHGSTGRPYAQIRSLLDRAGLAPRVTQRAQATFLRLAQAEARIHGVPVDEVHFHEVGSEDAIADVVGVAVALELLSVDEVRCSPLPVGRGFVRSAHGRLPLPAPATLQVLEGVPLEGIDVDYETVTPTGAALVATLATSFGGFPSMTATAIGYGAGHRDPSGRPNLVRAVLGTFAGGSGPLVTPESSPRIVVVETNLDDCSPELIPDASAAAMAVGALDVWTTPATMKKGRPGFVLHAMCRPTAVDAVIDALLRETSALGVRMSTYERVELERSFVSVSVGSETVRVKLGHRDGALVNMAPEHDDCAAAAKVLGTSVKSVYAQALVAASEKP